MAVHQAQASNYISNAWAPTMRMSMQSVQILRRRVKGWSEEIHPEGAGHALSLGMGDVGSLDLKISL
jgi:hypothetical protein